MKNKKLVNARIVKLTLIAIVLATIVSGCSSGVETGENQTPGIPRVERGEHEREDRTGEGGGEHGDKGGGEAGPGDGEESGTALALSETYNVVRNGARLILVYDAQSNAFSGTVENTTGNTLTQVRVEVHLSNGIELGPTTPVDLAPGEKADVTLSATARAFDRWTPHAEVGPGAGEGDGEHGTEGGESGGEHGAGRD